MSCMPTDCTGSAQQDLRDSPALNSSWRPHRTKVVAETYTLSQSISSVQPWQIQTEKYKESTLMAESVSCSATAIPLPSNAPMRCHSLSLITHSTGLHPHVINIQTSAFMFLPHSLRAWEGILQTSAELFHYLSPTKFLMNSCFPST